MLLTPVPYEQYVVVQEEGIRIGLISGKIMLVLVSTGSRESVCLLALLLVFDEMMAYNRKRYCQHICICYQAVSYLHAPGG